MSVFFKCRTALHKYHMILELAIIQGANAIFPVLIFPFMLINLGADIFSKIAVAEVLATYILIFSLYSFDIIGVQNIISKKNKEEVYKVYLVTLICRLLLFVTSSIAMLTIIFYINIAVSHYLLLFLLYPLGMVLQSNYYFQAVSDNKPLAILVLLTRGTALLLIYFFDASDSVQRSYFFVIFISSGYFLSGLFSVLYILFKNRKLRVDIHFSDISSNILSGWHLFMANVFVILYRNSNVLILGALASPAATAIYATAEKVIKCVQAIATPVNQFYFTNLLKNHEVRTHPYGIGEYRYAIWKSTNVQLIIMVMIVSVLSFMGAVVLHISGSLTHMWGTIIILSIMSTAIFMGVINFMFGSIGLSVIGLKKEFSVMTAMTGLATIILSLILSYLFSEKGAALAYVSAELILMMMIFRLYSVRKL